METIFDINRIPNEFYGITFTETERNMLAKGLTSFYHEGFVKDNEVFNGKIWLSEEDNQILVNVKKRDNILFIPEEIDGYKLTNDDINKLKNGEFLKIPNGLTVGIDHDLNCITISSGIPMANVIEDRLKEFGKYSISGYELSKEEINTLINGGTIGPKVFVENNEYFISKLSFSIDGMGLTYHDSFEISNSKAQELIPKINGIQLNETPTIIDNTNYTSQQVNQSEEINDTKTISDVNGNLIHEDTVKQTTQSSNLNISSQTIPNTSEQIPIKPEILVSEQFAQMVNTMDKENLAKLTKNGHTLSDNEIAYVLSNNNITQENKDFILQLNNITESKSNEISTKYGITEESKLHSVKQDTLLKDKKPKTLDKEANVINSMFQNM